MKLKELEAEGAFVSDEPVRKSVTWKHGGKEDTFDILVKRSSYSDIELRLLAPDEQSRSALTISQSIVLPDDAQGFTYEQAKRIKPSLMKVLLKAVQEVNKEDEEAAAKN
jgi:hypothetical protein